LLNANGPESANIEEAEVLARKALRIMKKLRGPVSDEMSDAFNVLMSIIFLKKRSR
jgi:hypothetical protein